MAASEELRAQLRKRADEMICETWTAIRDLSDMPAEDFSCNDGEVFYALTRHPAVQSRLELAREARPKDRGGCG